LRITCTAMDSSGYTNHVYHYCKTRFSKRIFAIKGSNQAAQPIVGTMTRSNRMKCPVYRIGTDTAKDVIYGRLRLLPTQPTDEKPEISFPPGYMHYTSRVEARFDSEYFKMLTAESVKIKTIKGFPVRYYEKDPGARNEAIDLRVYSLAALHILQPDWILLTKRLAQKQRTYTVRTEKQEPNAESESQQKTEPEPQESKPVVKPARKSFVPRRSGFVNSWRKKF
jgi:phage terminase large subunit GpA-like protein